MSSGRKPSSTCQDVAEYLATFVDFVQGVSLKEIQKGDFSESIVQVEWRKLSRGQDISDLRKTLKSISHSLKGLSKSLSKKDQKVLKLIGAALSKIEAFSLSKKAKEFEQLVQMKEYSELKAIVEELSKKSKEGSREFLDHLDIVKNDAYYELFSILKEDGSKFYSNALIEELKGSLDLTLLEDADSTLAPVLSFSEMLDKDLQAFAAEVVQTLKASANQFLELSYSGKLTEPSLLLRKALMALMLTASKTNSLVSIPAKACSYYFQDFLHFMREAISHAAFVALLKAKSLSQKEQKLIELAFALCYQLHYRKPSDHSKFSIIQDLIARAKLRYPPKEIESNWICELRSDIDSFRRELDHYVHGPLIKVWDFMQKGREETLFDPWKLRNYASWLAEVSVEEKGEKMHLLRVPSPTLQTHINRAILAPEFTAFFRFDSFNTHLLIDLNDPSCEFEKARALVLQEKSSSKDLCEQLNYINLPSGSEFYQQDGKAASLSNATKFLAAFQRLIDKDPFNVSHKIESYTSSKEMKADLKWIYKELFEGKETLSIKERRCIIDLFYLVVSLKIARKLNPTSLSFTCKDGVDRAAVLEGLTLYISVKVQKGGLATVLKHLYELIFEIPMIVRERALNFRESERLLFALQTLDPSVEAFIERLKG